MEATKYCPICKLDLPKSEFYARKASKDKLQSSCKKHAKTAVAKSRATAIAIKKFQETPMPKSKMEFFNGVFQDALRKVDERESLLISLMNVIAEVTAKINEAIPANPSYFYYAPKVEQKESTVDTENTELMYQEPRARKRYEHKSTYEREVLSKIPGATKQNQTDKKPADQIAVDVHEEVKKKDLDDNVAPMASDQQELDSFPEPEPSSMAKIISKSVPRAVRGSLPLVVLSAAFIDAKSNDGKWSVVGDKISYKDGNRFRTLTSKKAAKELFEVVNGSLEDWASDKREDVTKKYNSSSGEKKMKYGRILDAIDDIDELIASPPKNADRAADLIALIDNNRMPSGRKQSILMASSAGKQIGSSY